MALFVIQGPPAGGKTTWVRERAKHGDVVIDLDAMASALTPGGDGHTHPHAVLRCAQRARSVAIDEALKHTADVDVYVIHAMPSARAMARYTQHGAHVITIDPGQDVVMGRIAAERPHTARAMAAKWYAQHGHTPQPMAEASRRW
jgi:AAA domain-containing protein